MIRTILALVLCSASAAFGSETQSLAGKWQVSLDPKDQGLQQNWPAVAMHGVDISLPGTTDLAGLGDVTTGSAPGHLTRVHKYYGPAWYSRTIDIPASWADRRISLELERVIWQSRVWVDGHEVSQPEESLDTPHLHDLGKLSPGQHTLLLRLDNRMIEPIGIDGHNFTEQTQSIWNGVVGRIELHAEPAVRVQQVRAFPDAAGQRVHVEATIDNGSAPVDAVMQLTLADNVSEGLAGTLEQPVHVESGSHVMSFDVPVKAPPKLWDEFSPNLYTLTTRLSVGKDTSECSTVFGFRTLNRVGQHLAINGRVTFMRGNMDHSVFPLTGFPPTDVESWRRVFRIYKQYGFNQMRCHSWTPPDAAFTAADQEGIYIQAELFWMQYGLGGGGPVGKMKSEPDMPDSFKSSDRSPDAYVKAELRRIVDTYGNHPSLVFVVIGNELGKTDWPVAAQWIADEKAHDPRHWYAASTARQITASDDFSDTHAVPKVGWVRDRIEAFNDWDYQSLYTKAPVPIIAHELGQWPTYPMWSEIGTFTGVLAARNLQECEDSAKAHGVLDQDEAFHKASGAMAIRLYKDEMESHLRTADCEGFSTLCMQDYPGQGEAMIGWLDSFFNSKGITTPERFRQWCAPVTILARLPNYVWTHGQPITGSAVVANYGPSDLTQTAAQWRLLGDDGKVISHGDLSPASVKTGSVATIGQFSIPTDALPLPARLKVQLVLESDQTPITNDWDVWIVDDAPVAAMPSDLFVTSTVDQAIDQLANGKRVLLMASDLGGKRNKTLANLKPVYWSARYFVGKETLGGLVDNKHPALAAFPTDDHLDWEWNDLCKTGHGFVIDSLPLDLHPIVQPVPDFHLNNRFATIFEAKSSSGGKLMLCGYDIEHDLDHRPAARQLRESLLKYLSSDGFKPTVEVEPNAIRSLFTGDATQPSTRAAVGH